MGFDGEHIGETILRALGRKGVKLTTHKAKFDILTAREAWEVKTVGRDALHQMSVKAEQKLAKLKWAKARKLKPKSMMVIVNDVAEVYIKDGIGKFRAGGMKKVKTYKNWRKDVGHGRIERLVEGRPLPVFLPAKSIKEAEKWAKNNIRGLKEVSFKGFDIAQVNSVLSELNTLQNRYGRLGTLEGIEIKSKSFGLAGRMRGAKVLEIREDITDAFLIRLKEAGIDGWTKIKSGLSGLIDHEIGHTFTPDIWSVKAGKTTLTSFGKRLDKFFEANKERIRKEISEYAASIRHEFVAEAFAMREAGTAPKWTIDWLISEGI